MMTRLIADERAIASPTAAGGAGAPARWRGAVALLTGAALLALPGCGDWRLFSSRSSSDLRMVSEAHNTQFSPAMRTAVYRSADSSSAEIYLTDLPLERVTDLDDPLTDVAGTIVHVVIFMQPKAGRTPIDNAACNASIRQMVLSGPERGLYGGGGFVVPQGLGKASMRSSVSGATLRLVRASSGFADALGPSQLEGTFKSSYDEGNTRVLAQRFAQLLGTMKDVKQK